MRPMKRSAGTQSHNMGGSQTATLWQPKTNTVEGSVCVCVCGGGERTHLALLTGKLKKCVYKRWLQIGCVYVSI